MWNLVGRIAPIGVALLVTPALIRALGDARWGIFTLVLSLIGTFGILDFGLGRALTRAVAHRVGEGEDQQAASLVLTGLMGSAAVGLLGGCVVAALAGYWMQSNLRINPDRQQEVLIALYILCASAPLVILNAALWGVISAFQRFRAANLINLPIITMYYLGPLMVLQVWNSLIGVMLVLVGCRLVMTVAYWRLCVQAMPGLRDARPAAEHLRPLLRLGGWMTVSNLMFPLLMYIDRFFIASMLNTSQAGYYSTPFDLVMRFSIVPIAVMTTAYPAMAGSFRANQANTAAVFRHSMAAIAAIVFPACLIVTSFSNEIMTLWIGADFAQHAAPVMRWLGVGILLSSVDGVVAGLIDGIGRPDVNARLSLVELALYVPLLILLLMQFGIAGVAMAWAARCGFDFVARLALAGRLYDPVVPSLKRVGPLVLGGSAMLAVIPLLASAGLSRIVLMVIAQCGFVCGLWWLAMTGAERDRATGWLAGNGLFLLARFIRRWRARP
jgi:O-antigen/teichoic acid export membrane protein